MSSPSGTVLTVGSSSPKVSSTDLKSPTTSTARYLASKFFYPGPLLPRSLLTFFSAVQLRVRPFWPEQEAGKFRQVRRPNCARSRILSLVLLITLVCFSRYQAYELIHARWAMLGAAGFIIPEAFNKFGASCGPEAVWFKVRCFRNTSMVDDEGKFIIYSTTISDRRAPSRREHSELLREEHPHQSRCCRSSRGRSRRRGRVLQNYQRPGKKREICFFL